MFSRIVSVENLLAAWLVFRRGKCGKADVMAFERNLEDNVLQLHDELISGSYRHGAYQRFAIADPKPRVIHKATVRDRVVHHAVYRVLEPIFEPTFIKDSYSCRRGKGTHRAVLRLAEFCNEVSGNGRRPCYVLQCDIAKFFASVDHVQLLKFIRRRVSDADVLSLLATILGSYEAPIERERERERVNVACPSAT